MKKIIDQAMDRINHHLEESKKYNPKEFEKLIDQLEKNIALYPKLKTDDEKIAWARKEMALGKELMDAELWGAKFDQGQAMQRDAARSIDKSSTLISRLPTHIRKAAQAKK